VYKVKLFLQWVFVANVLQDHGQLMEELAEDKSNPLAMLHVEDAVKVDHNVVDAAVKDVAEEYHQLLFQCNQHVWKDKSKLQEDVSIAHYTQNCQTMNVLCAQKICLLLRMELVQLAQQASGLPIKKDVLKSSKHAWKDKRKLQENVSIAHYIQN